MNESEQAQAIAEIRSAVHGQNKYMSHSLSEATLFLRIARKDRVTLLKIVDSQAQKIAELDRDCIRYDEAMMIQGKNAAELRTKLSDQQTVNKAQKEIIDAQSKELTKYLNQIAEQAMQIEKLAGLNHVAEAQIERQEMQIAEQAKDIERLKAANDMAEKARINSSLNEYYRKSL